MLSRSGQVGQRLGQIDAVWKALRPAVLEGGGDQAAADFDASVAKARASSEASDGPALAAEARVQLELVDALERVFEAAEESEEGEETGDD